MLWRVSWALAQISCIISCVTETDWQLCYRNNKTFTITARHVRTALNITKLFRCQIPNMRLQLIMSFGDYSRDQHRLVFTICKKYIAEIYNSNSKITKKINNNTTKGQWNVLTAALSVLRNKRVKHRRALTSDNRRCHKLKFYKSRFYLDAGQFVFLEYGLQRLYPINGTYSVISTSQMCSRKVCSQLQENLGLK